MAAEKQGTQRSDAIDPAAVARALELTSLAGPVQHLQVTHSTNALAIAAAQEGARSGVWVADEQTAGRGRGGHGWHSAAGEGLYVSVLARPELPLAEALWVSLAAGLGAQQAIHEVAELQVDLRWPNDLMLGGKKCGGILVETAVDNRATGAMLRYAVIGIGINVHHAAFPAELAALATSLQMDGAHDVRRQTLLIHLLRALGRELDLLEREQVGLSEGAGIVQRFQRASSWTRGKRVQVPEDGGYTGVTAGLNERGFLEVDGEDGRRRTVLSGGVREV